LLVLSEADRNKNALRGGFRAREHKNRAKSPGYDGLPKDDCGFTGQFRKESKPTRRTPVRCATLAPLN
jgi:hypothetical protein